MYWAPSGHKSGVSDTEHQPEEPPYHPDRLLEEQEHKGYGEDEGEREEALDDEE